MDVDEQRQKDLQEAHDQMTSWVHQHFSPMQDISTRDLEEDEWRDEQAVVELKDELMEEFGSQFSEELISEVAEELEASDGDWGRPELAG